MTIMLLAAMLAAAPAHAQEFSAQMPAAAGILVETKALNGKIELGRARLKLATPSDKRAAILAEIGALKLKYRQYETDPARSGIYALEISRLYMDLASTYPLVAVSMARRSSGRGRAEIHADIENLMAKFQEYAQDPLRSGIYALELSRLHLELANQAGARP